jgi:hypothetical protein
LQSFPSKKRQFLQCLSLDPPVLSTKLPQLLPELILLPETAQLLPSKNRHALQCPDAINIPFVFKVNMTIDLLYTVSKFLASIFITKNSERMSHNVPAVYDVFLAR